MSQAVPRPLYARVLRLRHLTPSGFLCFVFLEGAIALGILLALAELVSWWGVLVLPFTVAVMVKLNDLVAGMLTDAASAAAARPARAARAASTPGTPVRPAAVVPGTVMPGAMVPGAAMPGAVVPGAVSAGPGEATTRLPRVVDAGRGPVMRPWAERMEVQQQWIRQSATRRYE